jgi:hypothetical protein
MKPSPKRRCFIYSLLAMFVVTVLGCWLGYQFNWIRQRHSVLARGDIRSSERWLVITPFPIPDSPNPPRPLSVFGEKGYGEVVLVHVDEEREKIARPPKIAAPESRELSGRLPRLPSWEEVTDPLLRPDERLELEQLKLLFPESNVSIEFR